jgi:diguanylate cyclase (GGDEF)-like protein
MQVLHAQRLQAFLNGEADPETTFRDEVEHTRIDGSTVWCENIVRFRRNPGSGRVELYGVTRDISKRKDVEQQLRRANRELTTLATTDALTGLPNRRLFFEIAERALAAARRNRTLAAVMSLDLDRLKPINDSYGHQVGDQALSETARRLTRALRQSDTAARVGGDEFLILLPQINQDSDLLRVADKIRALFAEPLHLDGLELSLSLSIGGSIFPSHGSGIDALIKASDQALYVSKQRRDGSFTLFEGASTGGSVIEPSETTS